MALFMALDAPDTPDAPPYVDTPLGILTESGNHYHITEAALEDYAEAVLDTVRLEQLLAWSDRWLRSPRTLAVWLLAPLLWMSSPLLAAGSTLALFIGWQMMSPSVVSVAAARLLKYLEHPAVQGGLYVLILSAVAATERYGALTVGLAGFVLLRWGVVGYVVDRALAPFWSRLYALPRTDQVLRAFIVRVALSHRLPLPQLDAITQDLMDRWGPGASEDASKKDASDEGESDGMKADANDADDPTTPTTRDGASTA